MTTEARSAPARIAYLWGDDAYGIDAATERLRTDPARFPGGPPERWRVRGDAGAPAAILAELRARLATATMFGSGTFAIVGSATALVRRGEDRASFGETLGLLADGNGLVIAEETDSGRREPPSKAVAEAVRGAGGIVERHQAPREGALANWIQARATERGVVLGPGAARELATRVGGFVREGDVDRRNQGRLAVAELEKLSLRRAGHEPPVAIGVDDVRALVPEVVPGSIWAFVDAIAMRQRPRALELLERLVDSTPEPVLLAVLHRRVRELIEVADRLDAGEAPGSLVRSMRLQPFRAETLVRQARLWSADELLAALEGLLALDSRVKGVGGLPGGDAAVRLGFDLWVLDRTSPDR